MGNLFVLSFSPNAITAGASTALYGMFASIVVLRYAPHAIPISNSLVNPTSPLSRQA